MPLGFIIVAMMVALAVIVFTVQTVLHAIGIYIVVGASVLIGVPALIYYKNRLLAKDKLRY